MNKEDIEEFENQLKQEELEKLKKAESKDKIRVDDDGTVYEFDSVKKAWFPKIDEDFIAKYQLSYGLQDNTDNTPFWQNPPSDINSEEYKVWYNQYSKYYQSLHQKTGIPPSINSTSSQDVDDPEYFDKYFNSTHDDDDDDNGDVINDANDKRHFNKKDKKNKKDSKNNKDLKDVTSDSNDKNKRKAGESEWFQIDDTKNTNVYVTGLSSETTDEEFKDLMNKVGLVAYDPVLRKPKMKLYRDEDGNVKGDGRCCYMKPESVDLALKILDGYEFKGHKITVERAHFQLKGQYDPSKKKRKLTKNEKKKFQEKQNKLLAWLPEKVFDTSRPRHERIVVIKNVFTPKEFEDDPSQINEISADMREECSKFGDIRKVVVYDRHPEGVVTIIFKTPEEADICVKALHGRWFAQKQLAVTNWDGKTKYLVSETEQEMEERLKKWHTYLENDDSTKVENTSSDSKDLVTEVKLSTEENLSETVEKDFCDRVNNPNETA